MARINNRNHFFTGLFLICVSALAFYLSQPLSTFTDVGLGPGFIPRLLASAQLLLGLALIASGIITVEDADNRWRLRPLIVLIAIVFFGATVENLGLVIAVAGLVLIACTANSEMRAIEAFALAGGSAVFSALLFVKALGLSIPIWPAAW